MNTPAATVQPGSFLTLHYRLAGPDGGDVINTFADKPATLSLGTGQLAPAIEERLLGLAEGAFVLFYTQMGVPADQAFAAALLRRLVSTALSMPGGLLWLGSARLRRADPALGDSA